MRGDALLDLPAEVGAVEVVGGEIKLEVKLGFAGFGLFGGEVGEGGGFEAGGEDEAFEVVDGAGDLAGFLVDGADHEAGVGAFEGGGDAGDAVGGEQFEDEVVPVALALDADAGVLAAGVALDGGGEGGDFGVGGDAADDGGASRWRG